MRQRLPGLRFREIDASPHGLATLDRFYRDNYVREFPDPDERESLENMSRYLRLKEEGWYGANNYHIVVAEMGGTAVGGVVFDYLASADAGLIEFLFVEAAQRRTGIGRALLDEAIRLLRADARLRGGRPLAAVVAEMNDPYVRPTTPDNLDPFERAELWGRWGFGALCFPYVQPALSPGQAPVGGLLLIVRRLRQPRSRTVAADWVELVVAEYLRWAMRIHEPALDTSFRDMAAFLRRHRRIAVEPLQRYVGRDPAAGFVVDAVREDDPAFDAVLALLRDELPFPHRIATPEQFRLALAATATGGPRYHLWALRPSNSDEIAGMASFFTLRSAGFGGYIVLAGPLRRRGLLRGLIARIEARMMRDGPRAEGWFVECGDESFGVFLRAGFAEVPFEYRPPEVDHSHRAAGRKPERLHLLYKRFGLTRPALPPDERLLFSALREILHDVYGVPAPHADACYRTARRSFASPVRTVQIHNGIRGNT